MSHIQLQHVICQNIYCKYSSSNIKMLEYWMHLNVLHKYRRFPPKLYSVIVRTFNYY